MNFNDATKRQLDNIMQDNIQFMTKVKQHLDSGLPP